TSTLREPCRRLGGRAGRPAARWSGRAIGRSRCAPLGPDVREVRLETHFAVPFISFEAEGDVDGHAGREVGGAGCHAPADRIERRTGVTGQTQLEVSARVGRAAR